MLVATIVVQVTRGLLPLAVQNGMVRRDVVHELKELLRRYLDPVIENG